MPGIFVALPRPWAEKINSESTVPHPGSVPALPFGTDDWALVSVPASSVWLKLPKRVEWEIKYG